MKIVLLTGALYSLPAMHFLSGQKMIHSVVSIGDPDKNNVPVELNAQHLNLPFKRFSKAELLTGFKNWLDDAQPDMVLVFGCGAKIPAALLAIPKFGFYNVHFSLLPAYRGSSPVFWQLKNGESVGGITIHQMSEEFDAGPMLVQQEIPISRGDSLGLYTGRLSIESVALISKGIEKLKSSGDSLLLPQDKNRASYFPRICAGDLKIDWQKQSALDIENLVNAANPDYGGAITLFRGQPLRILELSAIEVNNPTEFSPGAIVHSDTNYGIIAACINTQFMRINIVQTSEGILSGFKLASLGVSAGERFESAENLFGVNVSL